MFGSLVIFLCFSIKALTAFNTSLNESYVINLTDGYFITELEKIPVAFVVFYAPWCHLSKDLLMELDKTSRIVSFIEEVAVVKIDCWTNAKNTCDAQKIQGYPTIKIFKYSKFYKEYYGKRKSYNFVNELINIHNSVDFSFK